MIEPYSFEEPFLMIDPYNTNTTAINIYFEDEGVVEYTVHVEDDSIPDYTNTLYLIVGNVEDGYAMVNLTNNNVTEKVSTLEELADTYGEDEDVLVNAEINVF